MGLENYVLEFGKKIYEKVFSLLEANMVEDNIFYQKAIFKLSDGTQIDNYFWDILAYENRINGKLNIKISSENDNQLFVSMRIDSKSEYGFKVWSDVYGEDFYFEFLASEKKSPVENDVTDEQIEFYKAYIAKLYEQLSTLEYDKDATQSPNNFNYAVQKQYNIEQFNEAMQNLKEEDFLVPALPSVQAAIDWWITQFTRSTRGGSIGTDFNSFIVKMMTNVPFTQIAVDENQIVKFRELLSKVLMDELSQGKKICLHTDYEPEGILDEVMKETGISGSKAPVKTAMWVEVNSVYLFTGKNEYIFTSEIPEEVKIRTLKNYLKNNK